MRKYIRYGLRVYAEKKGIKPSAFDHETWERLQNRRRGKNARIVNMAHGTKPAYKWR